MINEIYVAEDICYIGAGDRKASLFENIYPIDSGVTYNSYLLKDEKTVLFDTVDRAVEEAFFENLYGALGGRGLDYLVVHHVEPDHSFCIMRVLKEFSGVKVVTSRKAAQLLSEYFGFSAEDALIVKDGDTLSCGKHTLRFIAAPMVHWPEVTMSYDETTGTLFSADAFGSFGAVNGNIFADPNKFETEELYEARRYYTNIVGKYGVQVQNVLKRVKELSVKAVCPLHGRVWREGFGAFLEKYLLWSSYQPEERGVCIFCGSIYGHTMRAAELLANLLAEYRIPVVLYDTSKTDGSYLLSEAFRYSHLVFAAATYNAGIFTSMERLLSELKTHNFRNRKYSIIENGSWAPQSGKLMEETLSSLKGMLKCGDTVSMLASVKEDTKAQLKALAQSIAAEFAE